MNRFLSRFAFLALVGFGLVGCETTGFTERRFNECWASLEKGTEAADVLVGMGHPREIIAADDDRMTLQTWIYSRPERVGRQTTQTGEQNIGTATVPIYEDEDVIKIVEYRLTWLHGLETWERTVLD